MTAAVAWHRLAAVAPIRPLAWSLVSYAVGVALKSLKKKKISLYYLIRIYKEKIDCYKFIHQIFIEHLVCTGPLLKDPCPFEAHIKRSFHREKTF